jgi:site-specific DNA-methyltransferase (adenine-specific)
MEKYFDKKNFSLYLGDSLNLLKQFEDESFDMIFADPPYFLSSGTFTCQNGKKVSVKKGDWDLSNGLKKNFEFQENWIKECKRLLKPNGTIWITGTYHSIYQCGIILQKENFHILNDICWYKPNASPNLSCRMFAASHESLIWARKDKKGKHIFNYNTMRNWKSRSKDKIHKEGKQMKSVWAINTPPKEEKKFGKHPTQKPAELLKRIISASTKKGDKILDPFTGSSTTGLVAFFLGRNFTGIDKETKFLELSIKRFKDLENKIKTK